MTADADLLRRYLHDRDDAAFAAIVRKHGPMVFAACRRIVPNRTDAEDAFQATFLVLATRAEAVRPQSQLGAWLHGVAVRCGKKARDAARRSATSPLPDLPSRALPPPEPDLPAVIDDALASIPHSYRAAVVLCHMEGRSRADAARELGWSEGTLSGRLHRALKLLGERLTEKGVTAAGAVVLAVLSARSATASVPLPLVASTCSAAGLVSAGFPEPGPAHSLARGVLRAMTFRKLKVAAVVLGVFGLGAFALLGRLAVPSAVAAPVPAEKGKKWKEIHVLKHEAEISAIGVTANLIAVGDDGGALLVWEGQKGVVAESALPCKELRRCRVGWVGFSPDDKQLRVILNEGQLHAGLGINGGPPGVRWGQGIAPAPVPGGHRWLCSAKKDQHGLHIAGSDPTCLLVPSFHYVEEPDKKEITHAACSTDETRFVMVNKNNVLRIRDDSSRYTDRHTIPLPAKTTLTALRLSDDGKVLAVLGEKGFAKIYDSDTGKELCELVGHDGTVAAVVFTPDGKQVATANGKTVRVFDAKSGKKVSEWDAHADDVTCLAFTPDGKKLVTGSKDKTAKVWERE